MSSKRTWWHKTLIAFAVLVSIFQQRAGTPVQPHTDGDVGPLSNTSSAIRSASNNQISIALQGLEALANLAALVTFFLGLKSETEDKKRSEGEQDERMITPPSDDPQLKDLIAELHVSHPNQAGGEITAQIALRSEILMNGRVVESDPELLKRATAEKVAGAVIDADTLSNATIHIETALKTYNVAISSWPLHSEEFRRATNSAKKSICDYLKLVKENNRDELPHKRLQDLYEQFRCGSTLTGLPWGSGDLLPEDPR